MTTSPASTADADDDTHGSARSRALKITFGLLVCAFGLAYVIGRWSTLQPALARARAGWLVLAVAFAVAGQLVAVLGFRAVLTAAHERIPLAYAARVYFVSQLGKYLPGAVWPLVAVVEMGRRYGISRRAAATTGVLSLLFSLITSAALGVTLLLVGTGDGGARWWWLALLIPVIVVLARPALVEGGVALTLRLLHREPIDLRLSHRRLAGMLGWPALSWVLLGLQCWAIVVALGGPVGASLAGATGGFALAYAAGTLFVPAPAGAGVREAVLGLALVGVVRSSAGFGHDEVILVVLVSRVLLAVLDFAQAGLALLVARLLGRRSTPAQ